MVSGVVLYNTRSGNLPANNCFHVEQFKQIEFTLENEYSQEQRTKKYTVDPTAMVDKYVRYKNGNKINYNNGWAYGTPSGYPASNGWHAGRDAYMNSKTQVDELKFVNCDKVEVTRTYSFNGGVGDVVEVLITDGNTKIKLCWQHTKHKIEQSSGGSGDMKITGKMDKWMDTFTVNPKDYEFVNIRDSKANKIGKAYKGDKIKFTGDSRKLPGMSETFYGFNAEHNGIAYIAKDFLTDKKAGWQ